MTTNNQMPLPMPRTAVPKVEMPRLPKMPRALIPLAVIRKSPLINRMTAYLIIELQARLSD